MNRLGPLLLLATIVGPAPAADTPPNFEDHVLPILREHCCSCHNADRKKGGLDLTSHGQAMAGGGSGEVIAAGDPDGSTLWMVVSHASEPKMPPESDKLASEPLDVIRRWIAGGALERSGAAPIVKKTASIALAADAATKPEGPAVMPPRLSLDVVSEAKRPTTITALAASPHGEVAATGGRRQVLLHHTTSLAFLGVLPFPEGVVKTVRFSRNGKLLLAGGGAAAKSGRVVVWDVARAERVVEVGDEFDEVLAADITADQRFVALGGPAKVVRLLATADGAVKHEIRRHTDWITALEFSPDGKFLATGDRAGNLFLWETRGAREAGVLRGHPSAVTSVAWRGDGKVLASSSADGTTRLWDPKGASQIKSISAHGGGVESVAWLPDGRFATTGRDRAVKIWKADGQVERSMGPLAEIGTRIAVTADGAWVLVGDWGGQVAVLSTVDGRRGGSLDTNPPRLEKRLREAQAAFEEVAAEARGPEEKVRAAMNAIQLAESQVAAARKEFDEANAQFEAVKSRESEAAGVVDRLKTEIEFARSRAGDAKR